jgi:hypothetical protein
MQERDEPPDVASSYRQDFDACLRRLEKTLSVTVRDGTNGRCRGGGRERSPAVAQSPNAAPTH